MKKIIPIILSLSMIFCCISISFVNADIEKSEFKSSEKKQLSTDSRLFSTVGIDAESLQVACVAKNGQIQYLASSDGSIEDTFEIKKTDSGEVQIDVYEGSIHDTIVYQNDGSLLVNGEKIVISSKTTTSVTPRGRTSVFSKKPLKGTSKDYTKYVKTYVKKNIETKSKIKSLAIGTIATILAYALKANLLQNIAVNMLTSIASNIRSAAEKYAPNSAYLSYSVKKYAYKRNTVIDKYYKHVGSYYVKKNCTGHAEKSSFYEYNFIQ
jgi:hypothetical protein